MEHKSIADMFNSDEYEQFRNLMSKAASETSIKVKDNYLVYGKKKVKIPNFKSVNDAIKLLEKEKIDLLMRYNDLYDKIIISSTPAVFERTYNSIVNRIHEIDNKIDEIIAYVDAKNTESIYAPLGILLDQVEANRQIAEGIIAQSTEKVHIEKKDLQELVRIHKQSAVLDGVIEETLSQPAMNYIIWQDEEANKTKKGIKFERNVTQGEDSVSLSSKKTVPKSSKPLTKKASIQKKAKKALLQEIEF